MNESLLHRIARNEPDAVRDCIARYEGLIWSLAARFCRNRTDAEDAVQNVFVELWRSAGRYDPRLGSETTFVSVIARRELIDGFRKMMRNRQGRLCIGDQEEVPARSQTPLVERSEEAHRAASVFSRLGQNEQLAITLSIERGMSHHRVATATGIPIGTVKTHVRRGLIKLRGMLANGEAKVPELGSADQAWLKSGASDPIQHAHRSSAATTLFVGSCTCDRGGSRPDSAAQSPAPPDLPLLRRARDGHAPPRP